MVPDQGRLVFDPQYHAYWWDGVIYVPSVTQILDSNGHTSKFCKSESHAIRGSEIHEMISIEVKRLIDGRSFTARLKSRQAELIAKHPVEFQQFQNFYRDFDLEFISSEEMVHGSLQYYQDNGLPYLPDWAGTLDITAIQRKTGKIYIPDIKTGKNPPAYTDLQTAAYTFSKYPIGYEDVQRMAIKLHAERKNYGTKPYNNQEDFYLWQLEVKRYQRNNPS